MIWWRLYIGRPLKDRKKVNDPDWVSKTFVYNAICEFYRTAIKSESSVVHSFWY